MVVFVFEVILGTLRPVQSALYKRASNGRRFGHLSPPITVHISRAALMQVLTSRSKHRAQLVYLDY